MLYSLLVRLLLVLGWVLQPRPTQPDKAPVPDLDVLDSTTAALELEREFISHCYTLPSYVGTTHHPHDVPDLQ